MWCVIIQKIYAETVILQETAMKSVIWTVLTHKFGAYHVYIPREFLVPFYI